MDYPVKIVDYSIEWPRRYSQAADFFQQILGELLHSVDHIGSTSVRGLASKDRVDVQLTVAHPDFIPAIQEALRGEDLGPAEKATDHRPAGDEHPDSDWEKYYLRNVDLGFALNVHMRFLGRQNRIYPILFRDYLRAHSDSAAAYGAFKRGLANEVGHNRGLYCDLKDPVCDLIFVEAKRWAQRTQWEPSS